MQTPKARNSSSEVPRKVSPRASALEIPQKTSPRGVSSEGQKKASPRVVRQIKTAGPDSDSPSSSIRACRTTPTDKSPKVSERRSPRSTASEKKPTSRVADLECQISQLQSDLKKAKDQLSSSEAFKEQAQHDAEESKKQLSALSLELENSQKQLLKQSAFEEEPQSTSEQDDQKLLSELQSLVDAAALASAIKEVKELKVQLETVAETEAAQAKRIELESELHGLKQNLAETLALMEDVKEQLRGCKLSEAKAQALVAETLMQLETAKKTVEVLRTDGCKSMEAYDALASELDQSRLRVNTLEELVRKLKTDNVYAEKDSRAPSEHEVEGNGKSGESFEAELHAVKSEAEQLRSALEAAEIKYNEELSSVALEIKNAHELVQEIKSTPSQRGAELEASLKRLNVEIEELKANLMDKETELQGITEENEYLNTRLKNVLSGEKEYDLEKELQKSKAEIETLKASVMDKEAVLQSVSEENEMLKLEEAKRKEASGEELSKETLAEVEAARAAEREVLMKVGYMTEEVNRSNRKAARATEQLEAAQAANSDLEAELRRLKVQADQWRKAAEAAAAMLSTGNNGKLMDRTGSMDSHYSPNSGKINLSYAEDREDDVMKKKNANMLKKIGILWKKPSSK